MAARLDPRHVRARHPSMPYLIAHAPWGTTTVLGPARELILEHIKRHGEISDGSDGTYDGYHTLGCG